MAFRAVLDANVLFPFSLRDTLLRLAEAELYLPLWSSRILDEMQRNLVARGLMEEAAAGRLRDTIDAAFEEACIDGAAIQGLEPAMTNDAKDRHVLAAAVAANAEAIVTSNLKDFPPEACESHGVEAVHPDEFLLILLAKAPDVVRRCVVEQAADLDRPPVPHYELIDLLAKSAPRFAAALRA